MKRLFGLVVGVTLVISGPLAGAPFEDFNRHLKAGEQASAAAVLEAWGNEKEQDPQYFICLYNFHLTKSRTTKIGVKSPDSPGGASIVPMTTYDSVEAEKAMAAIKEGIRKFPDHYEMRFGLLFACKELKQFDRYLKELEDSLEFLITKNPRNIFWNNNESIENPVDFVLDGVQNNFSGLMSDENIAADKAFAHAYCDLLIRYFPKMKYGYSNKGVVFYQQKDWKKAFEFFTKAHEIDPQDELILFNIGILYKDMNDLRNAQAFFEKVIASGKEENFVKGAKHHLEQMKKSKKE